MKLLLTSAGFSNASIVGALRKVVKGKIRVAFVPTAANVTNGEKSWLINDLVQCQKLGSVDIVDISAIEKEVWLPRLQKANVIVVGGGNVSHLIGWMIKSGLKNELPMLLKERIYVGISAGSIVASKTIWASSEFLYDQEAENVPEGLGYVSFHIRPHLDSPDFPKVRDENLKEIAKKFHEELYALDDQSAVLCNEGKIEVVSEGKWMKYPKNSP